MNYQLRDADGKSIVSYQYTDFGETSIHGDKDFYNELCYNESIYDKSTGLYYLSARYYDPEDGRFISRDSYRGNSVNPSTWNLYAYCANNPVNYEDPSGHIAISRIIGGVIGGGIGFLAGRKIAKKTKAKGWKKYAIIAGCTIGGAAIGALAGPRVAKVAKKAASLIKRKIPSRHIQKIKRVWKATKNTVKKAVTKTRSAISKGKKFKKSAINMAKKAGRNGLREGTKGGMKATGESFTVGNHNSKDLKQQGINGFVSGFTSGFLSTIAEPFEQSVKAKVLVGAAISTISSIITKHNIKDLQLGHDIGFGATSGVVNSLTDVLVDSAKVEVNDMYDMLGVGSMKFFLGVPDFAIGCITMIL